MLKFNFKKVTLDLTVKNSSITSAAQFLEKCSPLLIFAFLAAVSTLAYLNYYRNGLGLAYNDARSHLDIGRRVVEGLKPGLAQLGSVWLPLPHFLMVFTVWNDFMWHSGLSGALISMISFIGSGISIYLILKRLGAGLLARLVGVLVFALNLNVLYLQSTAMTELLLLFTITAAAYELIAWYQDENLFNLVKAAFFIMLSTLVRYDGWFLYAISAFFIVIHVFKKKGFKAAEGTFIFLSTLAAFGIFLWFMWNLLIFGDPLYFALGPYSAYAQQLQLKEAGNLATQGNIIFSLRIYLYSMIYATGATTVILGFLGLITFLFDKKLKVGLRYLATLLFTAPLIFNILALYLGFSVLFIQGVSGNTWFNVRYGVMMITSVAILIGYLVQKFGSFKYLIIGILLFTGFFSFANTDAVTIDDARVGSSQKNVSQVAGWIQTHAKDNQDEILISAASHDAIIFSSGLPMKRFIHEGTGAYWMSATKAPDIWARYIVMRTNDVNDQTFKLVKETGALSKYDLVLQGSFADIYELKGQYLNNLTPAPLPILRK